LLLFLLTNYVTAIARQPIRYRSGRSVLFRKIYQPLTRMQPANVVRDPDDIDDHTSWLTVNLELAWTRLFLYSSVYCF